MPSHRMNAVALAAGLLVAALAGPWLIREIRSLPRAATTASRADQRVVSLDVGGMTCVACVAAVQGSLEQVRGVSAVDVRLAQHHAFVVCDRNVPDSTLTAAVHRAGPGFLAAVAN